MEPFRGILSLQFLFSFSSSPSQTKQPNLLEAKELLPTCSSAQKANIKENKSQKIAHFDL